MPLSEKVSKLEAYGEVWPVDDALAIEMACIRKGGHWINRAGMACGAGLFHHFKRLQSILWPRKKWHRWNELLLKNFIANRVTGVMGPASSGKSREACDYALTCYFIWPDETTVLVSSTDTRSLELRIWGEIKKQWRQATELHDGLAGHVIDSRQMITSDPKGTEGRDFRNGIVGVPCQIGTTYVGLGKYVGVKNKRILLCADEAQFMSRSFFDAIANLNKNAGFTCIALGNPKERVDALGVICEPADEDGGWEGVDNTEVTKTWRTRFANGRCVNLVGTDSPNFDVPPDAPVPFPFLITRQAIADDEAFYGRDSLQFAMMNLGMMPKDTVSRRVLTRLMCENFGAFLPAVWTGTDRVKIAGLDAAYGSVGGDRCVFCELNFGLDQHGKQIMEYVGAPVIIPVNGKLSDTPEDQIAKYVMRECERRGIDPGNLFYDSTGRGTLGTAFARLWSAKVNPIEFGGRATERPLSPDTSKTCREHYGKMVSELWFSVRAAVESGQFRNLPQEVMTEGCSREWTMISGNRLDVEPKELTKKRMGRSPDLFDALVVAVEGARQRGFRIARLGTATMQQARVDFFKDILEQRRRLQKSHELSYAA